MSWLEAPALSAAIRASRARRNSSTWLLANRITSFEVSSLSYLLRKTRQQMYGVSLGWADPRSVSGRRSSPIRGGLSEPMTALVGGDPGAVGQHPGRYWTERS